MDNNTCQLRWQWADYFRPPAWAERQLRSASAEMAYRLTRSPASVDRQRSTRRLRVVMVAPPVAGAGCSAEHEIRLSNVRSAERPAPSPETHWPPDKPSLQSPWFPGGSRRVSK